MAISFLTGNLGTTPLNGTVRFHAFVDGEIMHCEISAEALLNHFGAASDSEADLVAAFEAGRDRIEAVARTRLAVDSKRRCLLVSADF